ncbi:MAG: acetyl-CoA carboxylase biotin carboxylase subunit [Cyclobacteriaceae bacterium]|jgi:acetyl-CoA carboxylase biotin carboxylase subunit|nr:acetyl-CoA carboxylase biotin carboxylase subunit [Cyclobacteriaceae bacterium]
MKIIKKILVANRGEIALRIMRSAKEMNISIVAVFSEADRLAPHVLYADEAVCLGPAPSSSSYLLGEKIIAICKNLEVDAIHPGYGFLSENAEFAEKVGDAGLIFIGPSPNSIRVMGDKLAAKNAVSGFDIPMVPGINKAVEDVDEAILLAKQIGYPVLIKASAGGGGKGMRVVEKEEDLSDQMERAISEAKSAFGNGAVFIEKFITSPKHIEVQVLGDQHGNIIHLFERECSIQRRHQKVIEEAPSSVLNSARRVAIGEAAIKVAKACDYYGTGTVEFIVDENLDFFFLEMNTRLQVEHCVTEEITGIDLVKEQIKIAEGKVLEWKQSDIKILGHSIECRVYAEDPSNDFLPDIGILTTYKRPQGPGIRVDDGFEEGMSIPINYDPMIGKLITKGKDRNEAIQRMTRAIDEFIIIGVETTLPFCKYAINHEAFVSGNFDTNFIKKYFSASQLETAVSEEEQKIAAIIAIEMLSQLPVKNDDKMVKKNQNAGKWKRRVCND